MTWRAFLMLIFASGLTSSCGTTAADPCLTYRILSPSARTADFIVENDRIFAEQLLVHNETFDIYCR